MKSLLLSPKWAKSNNLTEQCCLSPTCSVQQIQIWYPASPKSLSGMSCLPLCVPLCSSCLFLTVFSALESTAYLTLLSLALKGSALICKVRLSILYKLWLSELVKVKNFPRIQGWKSWKRRNHINNSSYRLYLSYSGDKMKRCLMFRLPTRTLGITSSCKKVIVQIQ